MRRLVVIFAVLALVLAAAPAAAPGKATKGELTLQMEVVESLGVSASGKINTKKICADLRAVRVTLLNPPPGYKQQVGPTYGNRDKTYSDLVPVPDAPGTYAFLATAKKTRVTRKPTHPRCAALRSPVVSVTVSPQPQ